MKNYKKAYTLIEMLMVVAIIGVLASSILVGLSGTRAKARDSRRITDLKSVQTALELYYGKYNSYPSNIGNWDDLTTILTSEETGIQVNKIPKDPLSGSGKMYLYASDGQTYVLGAQMETKDQSLDDDLDGQQLGIDCGQAVGDNIYCISL